MYLEINYRFLANFVSFFHVFPTVVVFLCTREANKKMSNQKLG